MIQAEKQPRTGYKQTELGEIPEDWEIQCIGESCDVLTGFPFPSSKYSEAGVRLLRGSNVKRGETDWSADLTQYWDEITSDLKIYELQVGDIVISMDGSLVGKSYAQLSKKDLPAVLLQRVARIRSESIELNYLKEWVCSKFFTNHCDSVKTVTAIPHISPLDIKNFKLLVPHYTQEQTAIANALSDVDSLLNELKALISKKQAIKTATMQQLLTGKTRLPQFARYTEGEKQGQLKGMKESELGEIPEDWEIVKFESLCRVFTKQTGFDYSAHIKPSLISENRKDYIPFIQNKDFNAKSINFNTDYYVPESIALRFPNILLNEKSLLISISGSIGNVGIFHSDKLAFIGGAIAIAKFLDQTLIEWVMYYMLSSSGQNTLLKNVKAGSHQNLILDDIRQFKVPIPAKDEQDSITNILSDINEEILSLEQRLAKTRQIKQGMMQELLTGRTRLPFNQES